MTEVNIIFLFLFSFISPHFKDGSKQNHVSFNNVADFQQNGSAKQFANGTNQNSSNHVSLSKKIKRKHYHSHKKYRRLELGNNNCIAQVY